MGETETKAGRASRRSSNTVKSAAFVSEATSLRAQFALDCIDIEAASEVEGATWERFQLVLLNDVSKLSLWCKSRQIAVSFTFAAEAWIEACLYGQRSLFVSINQEEAKEKIRYARRLYEATHGIDKPKIIRDNELALEFDNGARLESMPSRAPRGKAKYNVYLDEFAHVAKDAEIYKGAIPVISKGGRLRMGSSPMGARGLFWEIDTQTLKKYPGYKRFSVPWWDVSYFCKDPRRARVQAPSMETGERVAHFGTEILKLIYENTVLEDFQQEYEAVYVDEVASWITWEEIGHCQDTELICVEGEYKQKNVADAKLAIDKLLHHIKERRVEWQLAGGVDIGRTRNTTEIYLGGTTTVGKFPLRLMISLDGVSFEDQKDVISYAIDTLPVTTLLIDKNGLGMNIAEDLEAKYGAKVQGFEFTNPSKKVLATDTKMWFQQKKVVIPKERNLAYQIHSIRRKVSGTGVYVFDVESSAKHHADRFWALALMLHALGGNRTSAGHVGIMTVS